MSERSANPGNICTQGWSRWHDFRGRSTPEEYWAFFLELVVVLPVAWLIVGLFQLWIFLWIPFLLWSLVALISSTVRRIRDGDRGGWWYVGAGLFPPVSLCLSVHGRAAPERESSTGDAELEAN